ncbi:hypothetical protein CTI14_33390, partial [Methylobacterium radiotolerans]
GWNVSIPDNKVQVKVQHGWVTLTGEVSWNFQRVAAESAIRRLSGVKGVANQIKLSNNAQISDVKQRIQDALKRSAALEAHDIQVAVHDRHVTLMGKVNSLADRRVAEQAHGARQASSAWKTSSPWADGGACAAACRRATAESIGVTQRAR